VTQLKKRPEKELFGIISAYWSGCQSAVDKVVCLFISGTYVCLSTEKSTSNQVKKDQADTSLQGK
jgi:hypothetical protein